MSRPSTRSKRSPRRCSRSWRNYGIKVQTINPGAYYTGYNETMADNPFRWLDDGNNFTKRADLRKGFDDFFATPEGRLDPQEQIDAMIAIVPVRHRKVPQRVPQGDRGHAQGASAPGLGKPDLSLPPAAALVPRLNTVAGALSDKEQEQ